MRFGRNFLILLAVVLVLAAGLVAERLLRPVRPVAVGEPLFPVAQESIAALSWELPAPDGATVPMTLVREGEFWRMERPYPGALCDAEAVSSFLDALGALRVRARLGPAEGSDFRVARRLTVRTAERAIVRGFGGEQPMALAQTLAEADGNLVAVEADAVSRLPSAAEGLRAKALLPVSPERILALEWRAPGTPFTRASRKAGGHWEVSRPFPFELPGEVVQAALDALTAPDAIVAYVRPADGEPPAPGARPVPEGLLGAYALDEESALRVSLRIRGLGDPVTLRFGRPDPAHPGAVFCLLNGATAVVAVPEALPALFGEAGPLAADVRDLPVVGALSGVRRLSLRLRGEDVPVELTREHGAWTLAMPMELPADAVAVEALFARLSAITGEFSGTARPSGEPLCAFSLFGEGDDALDLELFPAEAEGELLAWRTDQGRLYRLRRDAVPEAMLADGLQHTLVDRTVLSVPAEQIRRIAVLRRDGSRCAARRAGAVLDWETETPAGLYVDAAVLDAWLTRFADLKAARVLRDAPVALGALRPYGLERPWLRLTLDLDASAEGGLRRVLLVGDPDPTTGAAPALIQGRPILYELGPEDVALLGKWPMKGAPPHD